jgi:beta-phosphoglucomutase-like phosphatase (HAD superfamily)
LRFSISLDDVSNGKPHPEPYAMAAVRLGIAPTHLLAVEDSVSGIASARSAALPTAAIRSTPDLGADWSVDSLTEIADIILARTPIPSPTVSAGMGEPT